MTKIIELRATNVKRLRAITLPIADGLNVIAGKNGAGKSSVLDAIEMAFGGKGAIPKRPVRAGEEKASIVVRLDNGIVVTRHIKPDGETTLKVTNDEKATFSSPQAMLDALLGKLSFDPLAFSRMRPAEQYETLRRLMGVDTSEVDAARARAFDERTEVGREMRRLEGELAGITVRPDAPAEPVSVAALTTELEAARAFENRVRDLLADAARAHKVVADGRQEYARTKARVDAGERQLAALRDQIEKITATVRADEAELRRIEAQGKEAASEADVLSARADELRAQTPDIDAIRARINAVEETNAAVRERARHADVAARLEAKRSETAALTEKIAELDAQRTAMIEAAPLPMPGLALGDGGVLLNGLPFEQASGAEQLRASVAIGAALNPKLRVLLVRDGSLLDRDGLRMLGELAAERDCQVLLERVDTTDGIGVVIEDGAIVGAEVSDAAE